MNISKILDNTCYDCQEQEQEHIIIAIEVMSLCRESLYNEYIIVLFVFLVGGNEVVLRMGNQV